MNGGPQLTPAVVLVERSIDAVDVLQDLHAQVLGFAADEAAGESFSELSDRICGVLGQLLATGPAAGALVLDATRKAAERRGLAGLESVLVSAFLSAVRTGITPSTVAAAAYTATPDLLDRLAGGARRVPVADPASASVASVSLSELAVAMGAAGGSVAGLSERLRALVTLGSTGPDDPALPPIALACADTYVAVAAAGRFVASGTVEESHVSVLGTAMDVDPGAWQRPATQLLAGRAWALGVRVPGQHAGPPAPPVGPVPPGLAPRPRRGPSSGNAQETASATRVPGSVTAEVPTWVTTFGRTAELHLPRALSAEIVAPGTPAGLTATGGVGGPGRRLVAVEPRGVPRQQKQIPTGPYHPHILTGELVDDFDRPIPTADLAEALRVEAQAMQVDVDAVTVVEFVDVLRGRRGGADFGQPS